LCGTLLKKGRKDMDVIKIVTHYYKDDVEFIGDYCSKEIFVNEKKVWELEDEYHSGGYARVEGFIQGYKKAKGLKENELEIVCDNIADYEE